MRKEKKGRTRVAVAGFGFMGRMHYGIWRRMRGARVVALCDKNPLRFRTAARGNLAGADQSTDFGDAALYGDFDKMLEEARPDAVSLTLPTFLHLPLTARALAAGVSVLCEKPMALNAAECAKMIRAARNAPGGARLMVAQCVRFWPAFRYLKTLIDGGRYGAPLAVSLRRHSPPPPPGRDGESWFLDESRSGGMALDLHIHDTDLVQFLFGVPRAVASRASYCGRGAMQCISTLYDVGGNVVVTAEGGWRLAPAAGFECGYMAVFEKATVVFDGKRPRPLCVYPFSGKAFTPKLPPGDGYYHEIKWFLGLLRGREMPCLTTPEESRASVAIVEAEKRSAATGKSVKINLGGV